MKKGRLCPSLERLVVLDEALLQERARRLAGAGEHAQESAPLELIAFRLGRKSYALELDEVHRVVARIGPVVEVPLGPGEVETVACIEERPLPVIDLPSRRRGLERSLEALARAPALLVDGSPLPVLVAVEPPIELIEGQVAASALIPEDAGLTAVLADGTRLVSARALLSPLGVD